MREKNTNIFRRIVVASLIIVMAVTSIPVNGLLAEGKETKDSTWDGTFESEVLGKAPEGWELLSCNKAGELAPDKTYHKNYELVVTDGKKEGTKALAVTTKGDGTKGYILAESGMISVTGGKAYSLNYMMKIAGVESKEEFFGGQLYAVQYDKKGKELEKTQLGKTVQTDLDWESYAVYVQMNAEAVEMKLSLYVGGVWQKNKGLEVYLDEISLEELSDEQLLNGSFEKGSGNNDIYSWHLRSTTKVNGPTTSNWVKNYEFTRIEGYHGDAVSITRKGIGYVTLDSNIMKVTEGANYVIDYAYSVANAEASFIGVTAYVSEFDANQELLSTTALHSPFYDNTDWKEVSYSYIPSENAKYLRVELAVGDWGTKDTTFTACFDDVRVTAIRRNLSNDGINNGNFEEVYDGTIFDWTLAKRPDTSFATTFDGYNNTKGLYVTRTSPDTHGYALVTSNEFEVVEGQDYKATYMVRLENQVGNVYVIMDARFYDENGKEVETQRNKEFDHRTYTEEWQQQVGYYTAPKGAKTAVVRFRVCGTSYECWLDDVVWSARDDKADIWGFDAVDDQGNIAGWTISTKPNAVKLDKKTYREGNGSLFVSQISDTAMTRIMSDTLIPVEKKTRYKFTAWIKSYNCNVGTESVRVSAMTYDKDGNKLGEIDGLYTMLNEESEPSEWRELILGVYSDTTIAYVRPFIEIAAGSMNLWIDDLEWNIYSQNDEYLEDFNSVRDDGTPDGWSAEMVSGTPGFISGNSVVTIEAKDEQDIGLLKSRWDTALEYTSMTYTTTYAATENAKAKITIKFYDYNDKEIEKARIEEVYDATAGEYIDVSFDFMLTSAKYMMIELSNEGKGSVSFEGIRIVSEDDAEKDTTDDITWRGKWVWHDEDYKDSVNSTPRYFRYHFTLPDAAVASNIQITADDRLKLWVNGVEIVEESMDNRYMYISVIDDLADYLVPGENVIAVRVVNYTSYSGLLFDGYAETESGEWIDFYSSEDVVSSLVEYDGWQEKDFDDSKWTNCKIMDTAVGGTIWEDMDYDASAYVKNKFEVVDYSVTEEIKAGEDVLLTMTIIPEIDVEKDVVLNAKIWKRNSQNMVLKTELEQVDGPPMSEWKAGKKITVSYKFKIPDFVASEKYIAQLDVNTVRITNVEIMNNKLIKATKVTNNISENTIKAEMKEYNGTQAIFINGELHPIMSYVAPMTGAIYTETKSTEYMHDAGLCITRIWTDCGAHSDRLSWWTGEDTYDWSILDQMVYAALSDHEDTYLIVSLRMGAPTWWQEANPGECVLTSKGDTPGESFFSEKLVNDAIKASIAMIEHMKEQPYWNRIVGAVLNGCRNSEWMWYGEGQFAIDYSEAGQKAWKEWVKEEYQTDAALQEAWNNKSVTLDTVEIPKFFEESGSIGYDTLLDPSCQKDVLDYARCMEEREAEVLIKFAGAVTEVVDDNWIIGAYYGYLYTRVFYYDAVRRIHSAVDMVLDDPNVDFFAAPSNYSERYDGESGGFEHMAAGVLAHGKAVIMEDDNRLCSYINLSKNFYTRDSVGPTYNISDSLSQLTHSFASQITSGVGNWYTNLDATYFEREQFADIMELMRNEHMVNYAREKDYTSDVAYIIDEDLYQNLAYDFWPNYEMMYELLYEQRYELTRIGVSMDYYSMTDLEEGLVPDHKVYIMLSPVEVDASEEEAINKYLKNKDKVVLWQYICGASDGKTFSAKNMSEIIGMNVTLDTEPSALGAVISNKKHWLTEDLAGTFYGSSLSRNEVTPTAVITDSKAEVLAYMSEGDNKAALAVKDMGDWTSIFSAVPCYTTEMIRNVLKKCDIHIYSDNLNDVIYANTNYVAINCSYGGEKTISLDGTYAVYDVFGQTTYSLAADTIEVTMDDNSTKLYRLTPADKHVVYVEVDSHGSSKQAGYNELSPGSNYDCTIRAKDGYIISEIIVDGELTSVNAKNYTVSFKDLSNSHYVEANFSQASEEVEAVADDGQMMKYVWMVSIGIASVILIIILIVIGIQICKRRGVQHEDKKE